jgi:hypothetical protein
LLKNRKSARKSRRRRKAELTMLKDEIKVLKEENERLKKKLQIKSSSKNEEEKTPHFKENPATLQHFRKPSPLLDEISQCNANNESSCPSILRPLPINPI